MDTSTAGLRPPFLYCAALAAALALAPARAGVLAPDHGLYLKECGACHMPFSPELLPSASWRKLMARLDDHFGESAKVDAATQAAITEYLADHAAERASGDEARAIMASLAPGQAPLRITQVPYISTLHTAVLDPVWGGKPRPKTLTECGVCHRDVAKGNYRSKSFSVTDEAFRGK